MTGEVSVVRYVDLYGTIVDERIFFVSVVVLLLMCVSTLWTDHKKRKLMKDWKNIAEEMGRDYERTGA